jgi:hypothetical protein
MSALSRARAFVPSAAVVRRSAGCRLVSWSSAAVSVSVRPSGRSLSGFVCVACFSSLPAALAFSRSWGVRLPVFCRGCVVRRASVGWAVSVPVCQSLPV